MVYGTGELVESWWTPRSISRFVAYYPNSIEMQARESGEGEKERAEKRVGRVVDTGRGLDAC